MYKSYFSIVHFFSESSLVLHGQYAVYSVLCSRYGATKRMGVFNKIRCLFRPLHSCVCNEPFRVRRTAVPYLANVDLFGNQSELNLKLILDNRGRARTISFR